jgi:putative membrane protein
VATTMKPLDPATPAPSTRRSPLLGVFAVVFAIGAINPVDRKDWMLENALTALFVALLLLTRKRFPLSSISYTLILIFLCVHTIGSHYTYSLVPYDRWSQSLFGKGLNEMLGLKRNQYDRLVHFLFGLLLAYPIREIFLRIAGVRGFWGYYLPLDVTMSFSLIYELIEWAAAAILGGDLGQAYLGTQGDEFDAQKDMALATLGGLISMAVVALINWKFDHHFGEEMRESFTVKDGPLGEVRLRELANGRASS